MSYKIKNGSAAWKEIKMRKQMEMKKKTFLIIFWQGSSDDSFITKCLGFWVWVIVSVVIVSGRRNSLLQVAEIVFTLNYSRVATKESQSERRRFYDNFYIPTAMNTLSLFSHPPQSR